MIDILIYYINRLLDNFKIKLIITFIISCVLNHINSLDPPARALLVLMIIDWLLGLSYAFLTHNIYSKRCYEGIFKFILYFFVWKAMHHLDIAVFHSNVEFGFENATLIYLSLTEAISILENTSNICIKLGIDDFIPKSLIERLSGLKECVIDGIKTPKNHKTSSKRNSEHKQTNRMEKDQT